MTLQGTVDDRFMAVGETLRSSLDAGDDLGASVAVIVDGRPVVDIAGGFQDKARTLPFTTDTLACVYSSGKAICAALAMHAVGEGRFRYGDRVASWWPEFGAHGKDSLTVAEALSHQSGVPGFTQPQEPSIWLDWQATCAAIAAAEPMWEPGTAHGYHPQTFGFIAGEILRRGTGDGIGAQLRRVTRDVICGLSLSEATRATPMVKPSRPPDLGEITAETRAAFLEPWSAPSGVSRQAWAAAEIPASNMHASARGLADIMQLFATGKVGDRLSVPDSVREEAWSERCAGPDRVLPFTLSWAAGVMRETGEIFGAPPTAIGHYGFGGSCVLADPAIGLSFAYVPNRQSPDLVADPRAVRLVRAVYQALT